jgi:hypothetical protein
VVFHTTLTLSRVLRPSERIGEVASRNTTQVGRESESDAVDDVRDGVRRPPCDDTVSEGGFVRAPNATAKSVRTSEPRSAAQAPSPTSGRLWRGRLRGVPPVDAPDGCALRPPRSEGARGPEHHGGRTGKGRRRRRRRPGGTTCVVFREPTSQTRSQGSRTLGRARARAEHHAGKGCQPVDPHGKGLYR